MRACLFKFNSGHFEILIQYKTKILKFNFRAEIYDTTGSTRSNIGCEEWICVDSLISVCFDRFKF